MTYPEDPNAPKAPLEAVEAEDRLAYLLERNRARQGATSTTCPGCGTPTGVFHDPRVTNPHGYLGFYSCAECGGRWPLVVILERADDELLASWLHP